MRYVSLLSLATAGTLAVGLLLGVPALARNADLYAQADNAEGTATMSQGMNPTNMMGAMPPAGGDAGQPGAMPMMGGTDMMGGMMPMMGMMDQMNRMMGNCNTMMERMLDAGDES